MIREYDNLTPTEINKINYLYKTANVKDETVKQRQFNIDKLQEFKKVIHKTKKNKKKIYYLKKNNLSQNNIKSDPYKFKLIPKNIKDIMCNLLYEHDTSLQVVSFRTRIQLHKYENFLYKKFYPLDNYELHKFLSYFNYNLN
tara:strand:- start:863 stop:1288 length:426 start_codon:yes stop_codon:yes gene_type:complete